MKLSDGNVVKNASWSEPRKVPDDGYYRTSNFELPISAPTLFFLSNGHSHLTDVTLRAISPSSPNSENKIKVRVEAMYTEPILFETFQLLQLRQIHGGGEGLGIYQDEGNHFKKGQALNLSISVEFPRLEKGSEPLFVHGFKSSTTGDLFLDQSLGDHFRFGYFSAKMGKDIQIRVSFN